MGASRFSLRLFLLSLFLHSLTLVLPACNYSISKGGGEGLTSGQNPQQDIVEPTFASIQEKILLGDSCKRCHGPNGSVFELWEYASIMDFVVAGSAESPLLGILESSDPGIRMPRGGAKLSDQKIAAVRQWILSGANE